MTRGKHLTIALAIALPLLVVGGGLAMAANDTPDLAATQGVSAPSLSVVQLSTSVTSPLACDGCEGAGDEDCTGTCTGNPGEDCTGVCPNGNGENGVCPNNAGGSCTGDCEQSINQGTTVCPGTCGGIAGTQGGRCGRSIAAPASDDAPWCTSCDSVGFNEYPPNSPKYTG